MEEEGAINFKALRAKFQEEAFLAQSRSGRPAVAEKPKHLPPPGGHGSSVVSSISTAMEGKSAAAPRVIFRDALRSSGGKRPISFPPEPPQCPPPPPFTNGDGVAKQGLKDRQLPLVLPVHALKEHQINPPSKKQDAEPAKEAQAQTKMRKKGLLLPFKSSKTSKVSTEEPTYADLTTRPASAPGELPSLEKQSTEDGASLQGDPSECPVSSPDVPVTPPSAETCADSDGKAMSTLEKAKKKFSRRQMLVSAKPKSLRSPDLTTREKLFHWSPKKGESAEPVRRIPSPVYLPHLACIAARPFFKANNPTRQVSPIDKQSGKNKAGLSSVKTGEHSLQLAPPKKPLPDLRSLGPLPVKPPRPPLVDLSRFYPRTANEVLSRPGQVPTEEPDTARPSVSNAVLDAPEFPDFENLEPETADGAVVDIAALELEALDFVGTEFPAPSDAEVRDFEDPRPDLCDPAEATVSSIVQDLNLGSQNIIPLDPSSFPEPINLSEFPEPPEPDDWNQSQGAIMDPFCSSRADETELSAAECHSAPEEFESSGHVEGDDRMQPHPSAYQQDGYSEAPDNVYEDVESINRFVLNQRKHKISLKNPYADNHPLKEEASHNIWSRNLWGSVSGEHTHSAHNHVQSKERQSPNAADCKEQRKREKQRLEREKKEQKEREKKENEMKKKFKVTGEEEPMYHAKVTVASKVRKNDLPVRSGDTVSIIRTTNCPKGRWLARDANHKYGYISVMNVELNIKEMLELGKKAKAAGRGGNAEGDTISIGSRSSSHPVLTSSFTDDSEEWACEDETLSPSNESHSFPQHSALMSDTSLTACGHAGARHTLSDANLEDLHTQTRHEALQKLAIFFQHSKEDDCGDSNAATPTNAEPPNFLCAVEEPPYPEQEVDFTELELLPPPPLYADI